jgi:hypothetical protein
MANFSSRLLGLNSVGTTGAAGETMQTAPRRKESRANFGEGRSITYCTLNSIGVTQYAAVPFNALLLDVRRMWANRIAGRIGKRIK